MEYRQKTPAENGYHDDDDELAGMHMDVFGMMLNTSPDDMMDSLLVMSNICEMRLTQHGLTQDQVHWYAELSGYLRGILETLTDKSDIGRPNQKIENPMLYFKPDSLSH